RSGRKLRRRADTGRDPRRPRNAGGSGRADIGQFGHGPGRLGMSPASGHGARLPTDIGTIHFVGIGGIGMSGIAEVMKNLGYVVQGSDIAESGSVERVRGRGIAVSIGHDAANLGDAAVVVTSTAVRRDSPEVAAAPAARIPVVRRAEMLAELMRLKR